MHGVCRQKLDFIANGTIFSALSTNNTENVLALSWLGCGRCGRRVPAVAATHEPASLLAARDGDEASDARLDVRGARANARTPRALRHQVRVAPFRCALQCARIPLWTEGSVIGSRGQSTPPVRLVTQLGFLQVKCKTRILPPSVIWDGHDPYTPNKAWLGEYTPIRVSTPPHFIRAMYPM
jgi:hypothetical protein